MALTFDNIVDRLQAQFDTTQATVVAVVNERHERMVADSLWRAVEKSLGNTVSGTSRYALPDDVVDLRGLKVGTLVYDVVGQQDLWSLQDSARDAALEGPGGVFAQAFSDTGVAYVELYPVPETSGEAITGLQALEPAAMAYGTAVAPIVPSDLRPYLMHGARADLFLEIDERPDLADAHEARYQEGVLKLKRRRLSRIGSGPRRMSVLG